MSLHVILVLLGITRESECTVKKKTDENCGSIKKGDENYEGKSLASLIGKLH